MINIQLPRYIVKITRTDGQIFNPRVDSPDDAYQKVKSEFDFGYPNCTWEVIDTMEDSINQKIDLLWNAYNNYERSFMSGSAPAGIALLALQGNVKAQAIQEWDLTLWSAYYVQRDLISAGDLTVIPTPESVGAIPYSIKETFFG